MAESRGIRAGQHRSRITFDKPSPAADAAGGQAIIWLPQFTTWAWIHPLTGRERVYSEQTIAELDVRIRLRWDPLTALITAAWRARGLEDGSIYSIVRPPCIADMKRRDIELLCSVGMNRG